MINFKYLITLLNEGEDLLYYILGFEVSNKYVRVSGKKILS